MFLYLMAVYLLWLATRVERVGKLELAFPRCDCERDWYAAHDHPVPAGVYLANCI